MVRKSQELAPILAGLVRGQLLRSCSVMPTIRGEPGRTQKSASYIVWRFRRHVGNVAPYDRVYYSLPTKKKYLRWCPRRGVSIFQRCSSRGYAGLLILLTPLTLLFIDYWYL